MKKLISDILGDSVTLLINDNPAVFSATGISVNFRIILKEIETKEGTLEYVINFDSGKFSREKYITENSNYDKMCVYLYTCVYDLMLESTNVHEFFNLNKVLESIIENSIEKEILDLNAVNAKWLQETVYNYKSVDTIYAYIKDRLKGINIVRPVFDKNVSKHMLPLQKSIIKTLNNLNLPFEED